MFPNFLSMHEKKSATSICLEKIMIEELRIKGYSDHDIAVLNNIDIIPEEALRLYLRDYIHQAAFHRKKHNDLLSKIARSDYREDFVNELLRG